MAFGRGEIKTTYLRHIHRIVSHAHPPFARVSYIDEQSLVATVFSFARLSKCRIHSSKSRDRLSKTTSPEFKVASEATNFLGSRWCGRSRSRSRGIRGW